MHTLLTLGDAQGVAVGAGVKVLMEVGAGEYARGPET